MSKGEIETIKYLKTTEGKTFPPSKVPDDVKKLKGFIWREDEQPKKMTDIFIKDGKTKKSEKTKQKLKIIKPTLLPKLNTKKENTKKDIKQTKTASGLTKQ